MDRKTGLGECVFMSYKSPTNLTQVASENREFVDVLKWATWSWRLLGKAPCLSASRAMEWHPLRSASRSWNT